MARKPASTNGRKNGRKNGKPKESKQMGRPMGWTPSEDDYNKIEKFSGVLPLESPHPQVPTLGDMFGVSATTLRRRMKDDERLVAAYKKGRASAAGLMGATLYQKGRRGNVTAMIFYLKTQAGWSETTKVEHTGADGRPIEFAEDPTTAREELMGRLAGIAGRIDPSLLSGKAN